MLSENSTESDISPKLPWLAAMAMFMQSLDGTILNTALPTIALDLNHSQLSMQAVVVSYALTLALLIPVSGWLSDKYGTKRIFSIAVFLFTLGSFTCAISSTFNELVASRVLQAIGGSMMVPVSRLALLYAYPKNKLLAVMNFVTMPGLVGPLIGPVLGGWIVDIASWHWIFLINIPIGITGLIFAQYVMPNFTRLGKRFDLIGFILFSVGLISLSLVLEVGGGETIDWGALAVILSIAVVFGALYIWYARRVNYPIINLSLFKIRTLRIGLIGNLCTRLGIGSLPFLLPQMLQIAFLRSSTESGMIMMASAIATIFAKSQVVPLVKRFGYKKVLISNTVILAVVISMFALPDKTTPIFLLIPVLLVYGCVNSIQMSTMNTIALADLTPDVASGGNSLLAIMQQLSISFGVSVGALILRSTESASWLTGGEIGMSFKATFVILGGMTLLSALIFTQLKSSDGDDISGHK
ncbi:DHA2 family efflux MFS transporter permease subunit [Dysgonomonas macrotermitis]|uniref:Drug resistance transporter, EmrB/QacA subfamily n=1 Tax=Dysgonomonas macrotermitis TaxID=1346286 RepID=A0A1M5APH6_9BACT|nr:DHA2 family efflux MFS transporter permease subunit [Dysgonomonas macrotermitis]SHF32066.1 drug resistance transporter, EmrB/QacA subfamily [Dysgonomonas macrotermitis]